jgi:hypothetical protein
MPHYSCVSFPTHITGHSSHLPVATAELTEVGWVYCCVRPFIF